MKVNLGPAKGKDSATTLGPVAGDRRRAGALPGRRRASWPWTCGCRSTASRSARTCCRTWAGRSRSSSPTPPAAPRSAPGTCWARAPAATAAAWPSCGAAAASSSPPPLQPGDVVEMTVEGIGTIRNRVVAGPRAAAGRRRPGSGRASASGPHEQAGRGKVVVITGGGQGQGAAEARLLAAEGATVVALDLGDAARRGAPGGRVPAARRHRRRRLGRACRRPGPARQVARAGRQRRHHLAGPAGRPRPGRPGAGLAR